MKCILLGVTVGMLMVVGVWVRGQEAHAWTIYSEQLGDVHKVSKIQVEEKCFLVIEGWTKNGNGYQMHVESAVCRGGVK